MIFQRKRMQELNEVMYMKDNLMNQWCVLYNEYLKSTVLRFHCETNIAIVFSFCIRIPMM